MPAPPDFPGPNRSCPGSMKKVRGGTADESLATCGGTEAARCCCMGTGLPSLLLLGYRPPLCRPLVFLSVAAMTSAISYGVNTTIMLDRVATLPGTHVAPKSTEFTRKKLRCSNVRIPPDLTNAGELENLVDR